MRYRSFVYHGSTPTGGRSHKYWDVWEIPITRPTSAQQFIILHWGAVGSSGQAKLYKQFGPSTYPLDSMTGPQLNERVVKKLNEGYAFIQDGNNPIGLNPLAPVQKILDDLARSEGRGDWLSLLQDNQNPLANLTQPEIAVVPNAINYAKQVMTHLGRGDDVQAALARALLVDKLENARSNVRTLEAELEVVDTMMQTMGDASADTA